MNTVEIISLIYQSTEYLNMIHKQLTSDHCKVPNWNVQVRIVANDATEQIIENLKKLNIAYTIYNDKEPSAHYIERVYRCWNHAVSTTTCDHVCLVNSDMVFSNNWLANLIKHHNVANIPCSRLVESGKLLSGNHAISKSFGKTPQDIKYNEWYKYADTIAMDKVESGGLYMPCLFKTSTFMQSTKYPEGNVNGQSGDKLFFDTLHNQFEMKHITVFDSIVYHIQEGEKDE